MNTLFFIASKTIWALISPSTWLILLPVIAFFFRKIGKQAISKLFYGLTISYWLLIGFFPVGQWIVKPLETYASTPELKSSPKGIIVLGGAWLPAQSAYWGQWELNHAAERELAFLMLAKKYPEAKLVFTGGSGKLTDQKNKEAKFAAQLYRDMGINSERLTLEGKSRNTAENAEFSKQLISPNPGDDWLLITSAYHLPRAVGVFCAAQWPVIAYPVDHIGDEFSLKPHWALAAHLWEFERVMHEWVGLFAYRLMGKTEALFPKAC